MFSFLKKLGRGIARSTEKGNNPKSPLSKALDKNIEAMKELFCDDSDFIVRTFEIPVSGGIKAAVFMIDGLINNDAVNTNLLHPLMIECRKVPNSDKIKFESLKDISDAFLLSGELSDGSDYDEACACCLMGDAVLMVDGFAQFLNVNVKGYETRSITEPQTETVVRGPREGFTENLRTNTAMLRRKIKSKNLRMEMMKIGRKTHTSVCLTYLDNVANPELIKEVKKRLKTINTDAILSSGYIDEFIEDAPLSVFQTINYTEKPDVVAANLLEGRCALIIDGTPFVLTMPMLFVECFQSPEDYATRSYYSTFLRIIRSISFLLSIAAPAVYVALTSFHQELIPTQLLFTIAASTENTPFNSFVETTIMLIIFETIKEAGIRLPNAIGQTISVVGGLVMGQAAIEAGLVGAPVVVVIAFAAIASFLVPNISDATSLLRWYLLLLAALMGGFGIALGILTILFHLASLESFGSLYLYPYSPFDAEDMKDSAIRAKMWKMHTRPKALHPIDKVRQQAKKPEFGQDGDEL